MRVFHLVRALDVGGLEQVVLDLLEGQQERGITCHIGCLLHPGTQIDRAAAEGRWHGDQARVGRLRTVIDMARYIRRVGFDILHSHNPQPHLFAVGAGLLTGVPVVHTKHGRNYPDNTKAVWLNRHLARCSARIAAVSHDSADVALDVEKVTPCKVEIVHNGVRADDYLRDASKGQHFRREFGIPGEALVIGSVGRLSSEKRYDLLVQAFALFLERFTPRPGGQVPMLVIVGDGSEREGLKEVIERCGLTDRVLLPGMSRRVADWLQVMDIFSLSSRTEGTSITLLEASACSISSVLSDVGGNREIVQGGEGGFLVPYGDIDAMADCFVKLADDKNLRRRMGEKARRSVVEDYSVSQMVERYASIYDEALKGRGPLGCLVSSFLPGKNRATGVT